MLSLPIRWSAIRSRFVPVQPFGLGIPPIASVTPERSDKAFSREDFIHEKSEERHCRLSLSGDCPCSLLATPLLALSTCSGMDKKHTHKKIRRHDVQRPLCLPATLAAARMPGVKSSTGQNNPQAPKNPDLAGRHLLQNCFPFPFRSASVNSAE